MQCSTHSSAGADDGISRRLRALALELESSEVFMDSEWCCPEQRTAEQRFASKLRAERRELLHRLGLRQMEAA